MSAVACVHAPTISNASSEPVVAVEEKIGYPPEARGARAEGTVFLCVDVDERGLVQKVELLQGVHPALNAAALDAMGQFLFHPALKDGSPVKARFMYRYTFALDCDRPPAPAPAPAKSCG
jgi:TonB family protein